MRITEKGQVTIPKAIRNRLGVGPGSEVDFVESPDGVYLVRAAADLDGAERWSQFQRHIEAMRGTIDTMGMDGKAYVDWLRGPRDDLDAG